MKIFVNILVFLLGGLLFAVDADIEAVRNYWVSSHPSPPPREVIGHETGSIQRVDGLAFLERFKDHQFYCFPEKIWLRSPWAVVSVDETGLVTLVNNRENFNKILAKESIKIENAIDATEIAQTFLKLRYFGGMKVSGWKYGINIIDSISDIPFEDSHVGIRQRKFLDLKYQIRAPKLEQERNFFRYSAFTWSLYSGTMSYLVLIIDNQSVRSMKWQELAEKVGDYGDY